MVSKVNIQSCTPPIKKLTVMLVKNSFFFVPSKLSWGRTFEYFILSVRCLICQYGPNY